MLASAKLLQQSLRCIRQLSHCPGMQTSLPWQGSSDFLESLKGAYPRLDNNGFGTVLDERSNSPIFQNPWYIVAAVGFSASNRPEGVPCVFQHVVEDLKRHHEGETLQDMTKLLVQKLREVLFKSGLVSGYSKAINSLQALHKVIPESMKETEMQRDTAIPLVDYEEKGKNVFRSIYGDTADQVDGLLSSIYPDMGWFSRAIGYGLVYGQLNTVSRLETSYTLVAGLIASDTPQQIGWHLDGARRVGATEEEVRAVRKMAIEVARFAGVQWRNDVPEVNR